MAANSKGIRNCPCLIRMLLFHPITRDDGFHPPLGSFDASLGPTASHNLLSLGGIINQNPHKSLKNHFPPYQLGQLDPNLVSKMALKVISKMTPIEI